MHHKCVSNFHKILFFKLKNIIFIDIYITKKKVPLNDKLQ